MSRTVAHAGDAPARRTFANAMTQADRQHPAADDQSASRRGSNAVSAPDVPAQKPGAKKSPAAGGDAPPPDGSARPLVGVVLASVVNLLAPTPPPTTGAAPAAGDAPATGVNSALNRTNPALQLATR